MPYNLRGGEDDFGFIVIKRCKQPFVDDQESWIRVLLECLSKGIGSYKRHQFYELVREPDESDLVIMHTCCQAKSTGQISLATAGRTNNENIAILRDVLAGGKPIDQIPVELTAGAIVDAGYCSIWLLEFSVLDQSLQSVVLAL